MKKNSLIFGLTLVVVFQILVLAGEYANAVYPLWTGQEIRLKTVPVDPRSLFRGNYARLRYEISEIPGSDINDERFPRNGEIVFVQLKPGEEGIYSYAGASLDKPDHGVFIRGRIQKYSRRNKSEKYRVKYGIEALFAPKEKAMKLETDLRKTGVARIMLASSGKAALLGVTGPGKE